MSTDTRRSRRERVLDPAYRGVLKQYLGDGEIAFVHLDVPGHVRGQIASRGSPCHPTTCCVRLALRATTSIIGSPEAV